MNIISDDYTLDSSVKRFASVLPNIVWITDAHGSVIFCNDFGLEFLGLKQEDIDNEQWASTVHPDEISDISEKWMNALQNKIPFENIQRQRNRKGEYEWFKVKANPHFDANGEVSHWIGISINVNDEIELRKELEKTNRRMDLSIQNTNSGTWDWDIENDSIVYNHNWWEMLGYIKGEIEESTDVWEKLLHPEDKERAIKELNDHLKGKSKFYESIYKSYPSKVRLGK